MSYSLFPRAGGVGTPSNPKVEVPGRVVKSPEKDMAKIAKREVKKHPGLKRLNKILDRRMVSRDVVKKTDIKVSLSKLGVY